MVNLDESRSESSSTNTLVHELTVHVNPNVNRAQNIEKQVVDGTLKPGTEAYRRQLEMVRNSAAKDHDA